jgi:hypothetical protein
MEDLILGPALRKPIARQMLRTDPLDALCKKMDAWLSSHRHERNWRIDPEWLRMKHEFGPLYNADYQRRKREEGR